MKHPSKATRTACRRSGNNACSKAEWTLPSPNVFRALKGIAHELSLAFGDPSSFFCTVCDSNREKRPAIIHTTYEKQDLAALMNTKWTDIQTCSYSNGRRLLYECVQRRNRPTSVKTLLVIWCCPPEEDIFFSDGGIKARNVLAILNVKSLTTR